MPIKVTKTPDHSAVGSKIAELQTAVNTRVGAGKVVIE